MILTTDNWFDNLQGRARNYFRNHSLPSWLIFTCDGIVVIVTFIFAYLLRYNFEQAPIDFGRAFLQSFIVLGAYCTFESVFRSHAGMIRHTSIRDIFNVIIVNTASLALLITVSFVSRVAGGPVLLKLPISILLIHYVTLSVVLFVIRILIKMTYEFLITTGSSSRKNVIIFGAGSMGVIVKRVITSDPTGEYSIAAFLDNNKKMDNKELGGIPVFHPGKLTRKFLEKNGVESMIFAIKNIPEKEKSNIYRFAVDLGLEVLTVPDVSNWLNGKFELEQLKKIRLEDLLKRDPIKIDMQAIKGGLEGKTVLVTGAAGSIGSEIARQLTKFDTRRIILIDNAETPVFELVGHLKKCFTHAPIKTILADVTDQIKMEWVFQYYKPDVVYHAAAYKHVSIMEDNPHEAIRVNVQSTLILTKLAQVHRVQKFVLVSTDKAVNPTNVMGASKRLCEMILQSRNAEFQNKVQFVVTRFGNVLGSNGSVVPIFRKQIQEGGPVTVTHPEITRYFMTIPEACQLVLEAGFMGIGGEIFVFDMGNPVKIDDLARQMIRLSGFEPEVDIKIEYTGLRPGEKLFEELLAQKEKTRPTYNPKVKVGEAAWFDHKWVISKIHILLCHVSNMRNSEVVDALKSIIPEYSSTNEKYAERLNPEGDTQFVEFEVYPD